MEKWKERGDAIAIKWFTFTHINNMNLKSFVSVQTQNQDTSLNYLDIKLPSSKELDEES